MGQDGLLILKSYDFTLAHRAGRGNRDADCLSRSTHLSLVSQTYHAISVNEWTQPFLTREARRPIYPDPEDEAEGIVDLDQGDELAELVQFNGLAAEDLATPYSFVPDNPENEMVDITNIGSSAQRLPVTPKKRGRGKKTPQMADLVSRQPVRSTKRKPSDELDRDEVKSRKLRGEKRLPSSSTFSDAEANKKVREKDESTDTTDISSIDITDANMAQSV